MNETILASDSLRVVISSPGVLYTGSRFDWTTQVRQVTLGGHTFLTSEREDEPSPAQGWGLAGEFGIETPVGFSDCAVGEFFPKVGVGLLKRPDDKPYHFARGYEIAPARFQVRSEGASALLITADQPNERGYGWFLKRHWSVRGAELTLTTTLANTGSKSLSTEEYIHNFLGFDGTVLDGWSLTAPRAFDPSQFGELVDREALLSFEDSRVTWTKTPTRDFFFSDATSPVPQTWTLKHPSGRSVTETTDFEVSKLNVWGRGHVVSPELYRKVEVHPGSSLAWTRRWAFT